MKIEESPILPMENTSNNSSPAAPSQPKASEPTPPTPSTPTEPGPPPSLPPFPHKDPPPPDPMDKLSPLTNPKPPKKGLPFPLIMILLIVSFLVGLILATLYFQRQLQELTNQTITKETVPPAKEETILVGTDATFEPMEFVSGETVVGYDVDLAKQLGNELGAKVTVKNIPWDTLFSNLENKDIDMIMSSVTITDERKKKYDFSNPYLYAGQVFITNKAITASSGANLTGAKIGVQENTTSEETAKKYTSEDKLVKYPDVVTAADALKNKQVDAIISDLTSAKGLTKTHPELQISGDPLTNEAYGIVLRKGDTRKNEINKALESLRVKGVIADLKQKWLD